MKGRQLPSDVPPSRELGCPEESIIRLDDGRPIAATGRDYPPLDYTDRNLYSRYPWEQLVFWVLTAAASGTVGNLAYDALKRVIADGQMLHRQFLAALERHEIIPEDRWPGVAHAPRPIRPGRELRDRLVEIAYDVLAKRAQLEGSAPPSLSEIDVYYTMNNTWSVSTRAVGTPSRMIVEIDLRSAGEVADDFTVTVWYI
jgi:hypothetical protein